MKVKYILEATASDAVSEFVFGDRNSSTLEKTIHAADRALDAYTIGSLAATAATGGLAAPSLGLAAGGKLAMKGVSKLLLKGAEKGAEKVAAKAAAEVGGEIAGVAAKEIAKSEGKRSSIKNIGKFILNVLALDSDKGTDKESDVNYMASPKGGAGEITFVGNLKGASCADISQLEDGSGAELITWAIKIGSYVKLVTVVKRGDKLTISKGADNNAKAVFNKTEIPLYKLAILLTNIYSPGQENIDDTIQAEDIGSHLIGMDRSWLISVEDYR